ncbi:MAG: 30S ribosomal protein S8 [Mycoplasmoidaceae bacterium]
MYIDPISDLLVRIRMGTKSKKVKIQSKKSKLTSSLLKILKEEGYIENYEEKVDAKKIPYTLITLKYKGNVSSISGVRQISKPGLRIYSEVSKLPTVLNGLGIAIISTSQGIMTDKNARKNNLGGEVIAYVW